MSVASRPFAEFVCNKTSYFCGSYPRHSRLTMQPKRHRPSIEVNGDSPVIRGPFPEVSGLNSFSYSTRPLSCFWASYTLKPSHFQFHFIKLKLFSEQSVLSWSLEGFVGGIRTSPGLQHEKITCYMPMPVSKHLTEESHMVRIGDKVELL
ncbi:hypothetical protein MPTK1_4g16640 [Marchantia polymorpha subsp. ruderalis]|uniref:Uncharacterized protein n=2 Tax=Marchantia polymorpha TaxID=3197 RepID=A0AAF6BAK5_MARPO|nr:hypothetical protein MARPO_0054s0131 [Marchantia polymorpha]BBN09039.1 hypothetical protein Mp_4g16640 [Marchantia polymorpha subsp. ruderalis]|eukprot:PTQ38030.1 hypothetical protein MARPO_0054s0131 [Marchantia polymorpha]